MDRLKCYLCTDSEILKGRDFYKSIEDALRAGIKTIQLREKDALGKEFLEKAIKLKELTMKYNALLFINDRIDIALLVEADGVHVGQKDIPASEVKKLIGDKMLLGVSANTIAQAREAKEAGADYIGVGAVFNTDTKVDADSVAHEMISSIQNEVDIPIVAIGGIKLDNVEQLYPYNLEGYAVISAILGSEDIYTESLKWLNKLNK